MKRSGGLCWGWISPDTPRIVQWVSRTPQNHRLRGTITRSAPVRIVLSLMCRAAHLPMGKGNTKVCVCVWGRGAIEQTPFALGSPSPTSFETRFCQGLLLRAWHTLLSQSATKFFAFFSFCFVTFYQMNCTFFFVANNDVF